MMTMSYKIHMAAAGDTFDSMALMEYDEERKASVIIQANPAFMDVLIFNGGELIRIPEIEETPDRQTLPPWRR